MVREERVREFDGEGAVMDSLAHSADGKASLRLTQCIRGAAVSPATLWRR